MNLREHVLFTVPTAAALGAGTSSVDLPLAFLFAGILIDVDHFLEFWHDRGVSFDIREFFAFGYSGTNTRQFIIFHSVELLPVIVVAGAVVGYPWIASALAAGMAFHMFLDYVNLIRRFGYGWYSFVMFSFLFRLTHRFDSESISCQLKRASR